MASLDLNCAICNKKISDEKVILFNEETFKKCNDVLKARKGNNLKYKDIILPSNVGVSADGYHMKCYRNFTALKAKYYDKQQKPAKELKSSTCQGFLSSPQPSTSAMVLEVSSTLTKPSASEQNTISEASKMDNIDGLLHAIENVCFFCNKRNKKIKGNMQPLHTGKKDLLQQMIQKCSTTIDDFEILYKIENVTTNEIFYHNVCKLSYYNKFHKATIDESPQTDWHKIRNYHKLAYKEMCSFIDENIILKENCYLLSYLHNYYLDCLQRIAAESSDSYDNNRAFTKQHLEMKFLKTFEKRIKIIKNLQHKKVVAPRHYELKM